MKTRTKNNVGNKKRVLFLFSCIFGLIGGIGLLINSFIESGQHVQSHVRAEENVNVEYHQQSRQLSTDFEHEVVQVKVQTQDRSLQTDPDSQLIEVIIRVGFINRRFNIFVPGSYIRDNSQQDVPLVFVWHGLTQTPEEIQEQYEMDEVAEQENFIVVYPDGLGNSFDIFRIAGNIDLTFTEEMLDYMKSNFRIKDSSVYSTGYSNGGLMSTLIACEFSDQFAAVASFAGTFAGNVIDRCRPSRVVPYLEIHGTFDFVIPVNGNFLFENVDDSLEFWADNNGQQRVPVITEVERNVFFYNFQPDGLVQHYRFRRGTHFNVVESFPAQSIIDFFKQVSDF